MIAQAQQFYSNQGLYTDISLIQTDNLPNIRETGKGTNWLH